MISYDCGAYLDTLGQSLEYVDMKCPGPEDPEGYLRWKENQRKKATKITVHLGPRGGFMYLRYVVRKLETTICDKYWAGVELDALLSLNKRIVELRSDGTKTRPSSPYEGTPLQQAWKRQAEKQTTPKTVAAGVEQ